MKEAFKGFSVNIFIYFSSGKIALKKGLVQYGLNQNVKR